MCLSVQRNYPRPAEPAIRYKLVLKCVFGLTSMYYEQLYRVGGKYCKPRLKYEPIDAQGFHVFLSLADAQNLKNCWELDRMAIIELECKDFVAGGEWTICASEIWQTVKVLRIVE